MLRYLPVRRVHARQVLDSRGNPTVEVEVTVGEGVIGINGYTGRAIVPSGASTGKFEAVELRDGEKGCYTGLGVRKAVENVNTKLAEAILGENALDQSYIDKKIIETDGTDNKSNVGANAALGVSLAVARAAAAALRVPLYQYLGGCHTRQMPVPMMNILNGGRHADNTVDLQEFMIMPTGAENMEQAIRMCAEVYQFLRIILKQKGLSTAVGDEGGFAPDLSDSESVLEVILEAVKKAGYEPGKDISIAIDAAASELYDEERGVYVFPGEGKMKGEEVLRDSGEMIEYYEKLIYQICISEKFCMRSIFWRKLPISILARAMGYGSDQELLDYFGEEERFKATIEKDNTKTKEEALLEIYIRGCSGPCGLGCPGGGRIHGDAHGH